MNPNAQELLPGTRLIVRPRAYFHHGIYAGNNRIIHYAGWFHSFRGLVEEVTIEQFTEGCRYSIGRTPENRQGGEQVVRRARSSLGEQCYHLLRNNCEHFCNWCQLGESRSEQVETLARPTLLLFGLLQSLRSELLTRLLRFRGDLPKAAAMVMLFVIGVTGAGRGITAPLADLTTASLLHAHLKEGFA